MRGSHISPSVALISAAACPNESMRRLNFQANAIKQPARQADDLSTKPHETARKHPKPWQVFALFRVVSWMVKSLLAQADIKFRVPNKTSQDEDRIDMINRSERRGRHR